MKIHSLIVLFVCLTPQFSNAKLLDKIVAVVDDNIITKSQIDRIRKTVSPRKNILPSVFNKDSFTSSEVVEIIVQKFLIRSHINEVGYIITDDQVESRIKETEKAMGISRTEILAFLENNNMTFDEYFELVRETDETNLFNIKIIKPLISITDQEIKNAFYNKYAKQASLSLKFDLVDFYFPTAKISAKLAKKLPEYLVTYQKTGILPAELKNVQTNLLGEVTEGGLNKGLRDVLVKTQKETFSNPIKIGGVYHVFYVKDRDLVDSDLFNQKRNQISHTIYLKKSEEIKNVWFSKQKSKHFVKIF